MPVSLWGGLCSDGYGVSDGQVAKALHSASSALATPRRIIDLHQLSKETMLPLCPRCTGADKEALDRARIGHQRFPFHRAWELRHHQSMFIFCIGNTNHTRHSDSTVWYLCVAMRHEIKALTPCDLWSSSSWNGVFFYVTACTSTVKMSHIKEQQSLSC